MSLKNMTLIDAVATHSFTGGTPHGYVEDGIQIASGVHLINPDDTDYKTRRQVTAKVRQSTYNPKTGTYSKDKKSISYVVPQVLANGQTVFNTVRIEREIHPDCADATAMDMLTIAAQLCISSDVGNFWSVGSLS